MTLNIMALVSIGLYPKSARLRRAEHDARAVELGPCLADSHLQVVHVDDPEEPALRAYLGMGLDRLTVLHQSPEADAVPVLIEHVRAAKTEIVFTVATLKPAKALGRYHFYWRNLWVGRWW